MHKISFSALLLLAKADYEPLYHEVDVTYYNPTSGNTEAYSTSYQVSYDDGVGYFYDPVYGNSNYAS